MRLHEVHPLEFRPLVPPAGVLVEARLLPAVELPPQRRFLAGQFLWTGADAQGQDGDHREIGLKGAALVPIGRNFGKSVLRKCDLRPLTFTGPTRVSTPAGNPAVRPVQGRGRSALAGGPDVGTAVRTTGLLTAGRNPGDRAGPSASR